MHLRPVFEPTSSQIVNRDLISSFDIIISMVVAEETRMRSPSAYLPPTPAAILAAHQSASAPHSMPTSSAPRVSLVPSAPIDASSAFCRYCKKRGHLRDQCPKLLRCQQRPSAPVPPPRAAVVESSGPESSASFTTRMDQLTEQLQVLQRAF